MDGYQITNKISIFFDWDDAYIGFRFTDMDIIWFHPIPFVGFEIESDWWADFNYWLRKRRGQIADEPPIDEALETVLKGIVGVATLATLVAKGSDTANVIKTHQSALRGALDAAEKDKDA